MAKEPEKGKDSVLSSFKSLSQDEKIDLLFSLVMSLKDKKDSDLIPVSIFDNDKLSILEALVKYMKENLRMRHVAIGNVLKRSDKTVWMTYHKSKQKMPENFASVSSDINVPVSAFSNRTFTAFESLVYWLKEKGMTNHEIAVRLHRDDRTIWSVYDRVKKKKNG